LYYDTTGAGFQQIMNGMEFGVTPHEHVWHESDFAEHNTIVREKMGLKKWPMKLALESSSSDDELANQLIILNRLAKQARQRSIERKFDKVYLHIQLDGATNWTRYDVIDIECDSVDIMNYFNRNAKDIKWGKAVGITIITEPFGYGDEVRLKNEIINPAFMQPNLNANEWSRVGIQPGWSSVGSPSSVYTTRGYYKYGGTSAAIESASSGDGIESLSFHEGGIVGLKIDRTVCGYAWVYPSTSSDTITVTLRNHTDSSDIDSANSTSYGAWEKVSVTGVLPGNKYGKLRVTNAGSYTFYVDKTYAGIHDSEPGAWSSCAYIKNHLDSGTGDVNYIDIDSVPGDCEARVEYYLDMGSSGNRLDTFYVGRKIEHLYDVNAWHAHGDNNVDATCSYGGYSLTEVDTSWTPIDNINLSLATGAASPLTSGQYLVMARIHDEGTDGTLYMRHGHYHGYGSSLWDDEVAVPTQGKWISVCTGLLNIIRVPDSIYADQLIVSLQAKRSSGSTTADLRYDSFQLIPLSPGCLGETSMIYTDDTIYLNTETQENWKFDDSKAEKKHMLLGTIPGLWPETRQRLVFAFLYTDDATDEMKIDNEIDASIRYRARTEFLLGTE